MRFLNTKTYQIEEFGTKPSPSYAVLSHTWLAIGEKYIVREITYQDMKLNMAIIQDSNYKREGWAKLTSFCDLARADGWKYAWMDTCCIDKTNPSDTQEAINAMYRWYALSGVCYAHLDGVDRSKEQDWPEKFSTNFREAFRSARWFTRVWTLQELLAPPNLIFVDQAWKFIGTKEDLQRDVAAACHMSVKDLTSFDTRSVATRLSWAARRESTWVEDGAYALLGLFGISMPLCYGEGQLAFRRFQVELIKTYDDPSIFSWSSEPNHDIRRHLDVRYTYDGVLSPSLTKFDNCENVCSFGMDFSLSNVGLTITGKLSMPFRNSEGVYFGQILWLNCWIGGGGGAGIGRPSDNCIGLPLIRTPRMGAFGDKTFSRIGDPCLYGDMVQMGLSEEPVNDTIMIDEPQPKIFSEPRDGCWLKIDLKQFTCSNVLISCVEPGEVIDAPLTPDDRSQWPRMRDGEFDRSLFELVFVRSSMELRSMELRLKTPEGKIYKLQLEPRARGGPVCKITLVEDPTYFPTDYSDDEIDDTQPRLYPLPQITCQVYTGNRGPVSCDISVYSLQLS